MHKPNKAPDQENIPYTTPRRCSLMEWDNDCDGGYFDDYQPEQKGE